MLVGLCRTGTRESDVWRSAVGWRIGGPAPVITRIADGADAYTVSIVIGDATESSLRGTATVTHDDGRDPWTSSIVYHEADQGISRLIVDGVSQSWSAARVDDVWWVSGVPGTWRFTLAPFGPRRGHRRPRRRPGQPHAGYRRRGPAADGATVAAGEPVIVVEA